MPETSAVDYYASPRWSAELADCSMPMTFDQYSNCSFDCLYCFSQYQRALGLAKIDYLNNRIRAVNVEKVKRIFTDPDSSQFGPYVKARIAMQWGGLSDPFDPMERRLGVGLQLLRFFKEIDYPLCFSTKATWWQKDPRYAELFKGQRNWNVKVSIITLDPYKADHIELGVPPPSERLAGIERIAALDCGGATLRLRPFIIGITDPTHVALIHAAADAGATAVSTEFFCLEQRSRVLRRSLGKVFDELCGFDVYAFYKKYSYGTGYLRLNRNVKRPFVDQMEHACKARGLRFYVSDAHFKERCANGSCCGLPPSFNYSRGQFTEALQIVKAKGRVTWPEIARHIDFLKAVPFCGAEGFNTNSSERRAQFYYASLYDYLRFLWNTPTAGQSPYQMFEGIMRPERVDADGNLEYTYDPSRA